MNNYTYKETSGKDIKPKGDGWEYWGDRILLDGRGQVVEAVAVWRRDADVYGYPEDGEIPE